MCDCIINLINLCPDSIDHIYLYVILEETTNTNIDTIIDFLLQHAIPKVGREEFKENIFVVRGYSNISGEFEENLLNELPVISNGNLNILKLN